MGTNFKPGKECLKKKPVCMKFLSSMSIKINELFKSQLLIDLQPELNATTQGSSGNGNGLSEHTSTSWSKLDLSKLILRSQ